MTVGESVGYSVRLPGPRRTGPVARRRLLRSLGLLGVLWLSGLVPVLAGAPSWLTTFGLGLAMPGGGLLYTSHWVTFAAGVVLFVMSVFVWWSAGPVLLPPLVWLGLAVTPLVHHDEVWPSGAWVVLATPPALLAAAVLLQEFRYRGQVRRGQELAPRLARQTFVEADAPEVPPVAESTEEDLAALRYALDLALQPLDRVDGFTKIDQFREAALRYQLNSLGYALSTAQFTRTPAFTGYLAEAQRNAIHKVLDKRVWRYWALENLWGNLRWNPDPADRENIMLTGFFGVQVGMYAALNDDRFSTPGALTFRWNDRRVYPNSLTTLAESVHRNMLAADWTLYPCEPNWTYTVCNTFGLNTLLLHDRLHGTRLADDITDKLRHSYDTEFLRPDGRIIGVRCERLGLSWNFWASPAVQLTTAFWLHPGLPELARRTWWIVRDQEIRERGDRVGFTASAGTRLDPGNYRLGNDGYGQMVIRLAAGELGDDDTAARALAGLEASGEPVTANGVRRYSALSTLANLYALQSRFNRTNGLRDLVTRGVPDAWRTGPVLADAAYPEVLVARAVTDGHALDLTLRPGNGPCRTTLRVERLAPGRSYAVRGGLTDTVTASATGTATVDVDLGGRHDVHIAPR